MKYYVVSDIHSYYTPLVEALENSGFFEASPRKLIILGDLFDRGDETDKVQNFVTELMSKDEVILVRGNHEDLLEELVENLESYMDGNIYFTHHYSNGTFKTLCAIAKTDADEAAIFPKRVRGRMLDSPALKTILPAMLDYYETEHYIFVHGWIPSYKTGRGGGTVYFKRPDWRQCGKEEFAAARWYNGMLAAKQGVIEEGKTIVCGHFHASFGHSLFEGRGGEFDDTADFSPYRAPGIIAIDACTAFSGKVNVLTVED